MTNFEKLKNAETAEEAALVIEDYTLEFHMNHGKIKITEWLEQEATSIQEMKLKMLFALMDSMKDGEG